MDQLLDGNVMVTNIGMVPYNSSSTDTPVLFFPPKANEPNTNATLSRQWTILKNTMWNEDGHLFTSPENRRKGINTLRNICGVDPQGSQCDIMQ